jgi:hypothetical protein
MEDLRDEKTKTVQDGSKTDIKKEKTWVIINAVIFKIYMIIGFIIKTYKYFWIFLLVVLVALYPAEIGSFIGHWIDKFLINLIENIK